MPMYRLTVTLGRDTLESRVLATEALALEEYYRQRFEGGNGSPPQNAVVPVVLVDPVKAALQVVVTLETPNALDGTILGLAGLTSAFAGAGLAPPTSVLTVETEHVPGPGGPSVVVIHSPED